MFSGIAAVALPLAQEFGITREIDDRVMCPLPVAAVAIEKIVFSAVQSMIAAAFVFPLAYYVPATPVYAHVNSWPFLIAVLSLASLTAGALGLVIGTSVKPQQISLIFGIVVMPITFLGCVYYPWAAPKAIPWLQHGVLINPIVYMSEGLRAALTPALHHMNPGSSWPCSPARSCCSPGSASGDSCAASSTELANYEPSVATLTPGRRAETPRRPGWRW